MTNARTNEVAHFEIEDIIDKTVNNTLLKLGLDTSDPVSIQRDFAHLRAWRESTEEVKRKGIMALIVIAATGLAGLVWTAFKASLH